MHPCLNPSLHHSLQLSDAILWGLWRKRNIILSPHDKSGLGERKNVLQTHLSLWSPRNPYTTWTDWILHSKIILTRAARAREELSLGQSLYHCFCFHCFACWLVPVPSAPISGGSWLIESCEESRSWEATASKEMMLASTEYKTGSLESINRCQLYCLLLHERVWHFAAIEKKFAIELREAKWLVCVAEYLDVLNSVYVMVWTCLGWTCLSFPFADSQDLQHSKISQFLGFMDNNLLMQVIVHITHHLMCQMMICNLQTIKHHLSLWALMQGTSSLISPQQFKTRQ